MRKIKKSTIIAVVLVFIIIILASLFLLSEKTNIKQNKTLKVGEGQSIGVEKSEKGIKWVSSNDKVAYVDSNGNIVGRKSGTAIIVIKKGGKQYRYKVIVEKEHRNQKDNKGEKEKTEKKQKQNQSTGSNDNTNNSQNNEEKTIPDNERGVLYLTDVDAKPGDTGIKVSVNISRNPGILGMSFSVLYDEEALELVKVSNGDAMEGVLDFTKPKVFQSGCTFAWDGMELKDSQVKDGSVLDMYFDVKANAKAGKHNIEIEFDDGDIVNKKIIPIDIEVVNGSVRVK